MKRPNSNQLSLSLFFDTNLPPAPTAETGSLAITREIAKVISDAITDSGLPREDIARLMSELLGREVTKAMLNVYSAESHTDHNISLERAIAFDLATGTYAMLKYHALKCGARAYVGRDALLAELGRAEVLRDDLTTQIKRIKHQMEAMPEEKR